MTDDGSPWFVAVGASGGEGLRDIEALLAALPPSIQAVILVVLHRPWDRPSNLRPVLERACSHPVLIAEEGEKFERGTVYIGEPGQHLTLAARSLGGLVDDPDRQHRNRTVDLLFRSVARYAKKRVIGVVLSGSLDDGSRGVAAIHEAGGLTMVITPNWNLHRGMPENAIGYSGPIDVVGSPQTIAAAIVEAVARGDH
ncbi:chemotaxis protein CheB [Methylorubrum populi]|jgi:two-component system chemotaxis response regulator CheB|uniref:chemotaxis protein CheB n=1 Tax=Methylorubrum populi TaxID=223967 RepID=UPI0012657C3D|nr:chemotaxis protein CheB [Methylorubrum populi]